MAALPTDSNTPLDEVACGLMRTAEDGTILRINRIFSEWVGQPPGALLQRRRFQDLLTMGGRIFHQTHWAPLLRMQGSISEVKLELARDEAPPIPIVINAIRHEKEGVAYHEIAAFVARDRDKYERELVLSRKRLEELVTEATRLQEEAKDRALFAEQMIGIVSHDLRNPLSGIAMGAALLTRGQLSEGQQRTLNRILRSADRAHALIADLLDLTQARLGGGLSVSLQSVDLHHTISEALDELSLVHQGRPLHHKTVGSGECTADRNRLVQLLGNLVSNAVAYGTPGRPVTVTSGMGSQCFIAVHNEGVAIPPEKQELIFKPMTRGAQNSAGRSVGLGLFIVREIAKAHGGEARVDSTADGGTTFTVAFPRR
ncbi:MAG: HAMP domain-containing sensor histidine kinase [Deltaproteobacteria bacterium]|nr:HAMP domain-containing sensor histidine kinase [Deltaproteobacteria bacterium]